MKKISCIFLMIAGPLLWGKGSFAQDFRLLATIAQEARITRLDHLGNLYVLDVQGELYKYGAEGQLLWTYSNKLYGMAGALDVSDPLRVLLYYPAYQQVLVLNSNLAEISRYSFNEKPDWQVTLVASANTNGYWIYEQLNRELRKLSTNFVEDLRSGNLYQRNGFDMHGVFMLSDEQQVYVYDTLAGVRIFDKYGNYLKTAAVFPDRVFTVVQPEIYYVKDGRLLCYNYFNFTEKVLALPREGFKDAVLSFNRLAIINEKDITLWALKQ
ncbi:hypothetical protein BCY91_12730 [Pelobium manganitolerans]|uniref:Uncharacterized protein n=1 Tax=Pelobium manganitolerans TaxID=1842495 RepID=A0A419S1Y7_9SPHI|nr:hypothetical protein [Pelobium manganitolerans]RKD12502.1 hypothetical protein BCY91_12730 [Pelobium manganitolerans]